MAKKKLSIVNLQKKDVLAFFKKNPNMIMDTGVGASCPIARYLEANGLTDINVDKNEISINVTIKSPRWVKAFVKQIDDLGEKKAGAPSFYGSDVTGEEAYEVLKKIKAA